MILLSFIGEMYDDLMSSMLCRTTFYDTNVFILKRLIVRSCYDVLKEGEENYVKIIEKRNNSYEFALALFVMTLIDLFWINLVDLCDRNHWQKHPFDFHIFDFKQKYGLKNFTPKKIMKIYNKCQKYFLQTTSPMKTLRKNDNDNYLF